MKKAYRKLSVYLMIMLVACLLMPRHIFAAEPEMENISMVSTQPYNIMLLIDKSGSMNSTDEQRLALSAACQFVDQLSTTYGDKVLTMQIGALAFGQMTEEAAPLLNLETEENTQRLKDGINAIQYNKSGTGGTDLGVALRDAAIELQEKGVEDGRNAIVLFTDGYSDNVLDANASAGALEEAYREAGELGCEIYVIGLNQGNFMKQEGLEEIYRIADTAQTGEGLMPKAENDTFTDSDMVNYLITDNMDDVREFYIALYAHMFQSEWEYVDNHEFEIETGGVLEANITVYSETEITDVEVTDPNDEIMEEDGESYFVSGDDFYKVIRVMNPEKGFWNVYVTSHDENYKTYVVRFYGVEAAVSASWGEASEFPDSTASGDHVGQVVVTPMFRDEPYEDEDFARGIIIKEFNVQHGGKSEDYPLDYDDKTGTFVGYFPVEDGDYHIKATLEDNNMERTVECDLSVDVPEPIRKFDMDIGAFELKKEENQTVDVSALAKVKDLEIKSVSVDETVSGAKVTDKKGEIVISGTDKGEGVLKLEAVDGSRNEYTLTGRITVKEDIPWKKIGIAAGAFGALVLLILLIVLLSNRFKYAKGAFEILVDDKNENRLTGTVSAYPKGRYFSLWIPVSRLISDCSASAAEGERLLFEKLEAEQKEISARKLKVVKDDKKKVYKLKENKALYSLNRSAICYRSRNLTIRIRFIPAD